MFGNKKIEELGIILYYIDCNSGYDENAELIDYGDASSFEGAVANIKNDFSVGKHREPFDLVKHGGKSWGGDWKNLCQRCAIEREEYIQKFFDYVKTNNVEPNTVFKALKKWEQEHFRLGFPFGLPYARLFLAKWRSFSW